MDSHDLRVAGTGNVPQLYRDIGPRVPWVIPLVHSMLLGDRGGNLVRSGNTYIIPDKRIPVL